MDLSEKATSQNEHIDTVESLQTQLADCRAQLEHWQGVATICELSKQEELGELQRQCDQEIQSLQEALRETASQYEARISTLQSERTHWRKNDGTTDKSSAKKGRGSSGTCTSESQTSESPTNSFQEPEARIPSDRAYSQSAELESEGTGLIMEGYFSQHCDSASLSSFSLDTPSLLRRPPPQDDTASLVSTGTLVPEAIYLPPPGHRLVTHSDWDALNSQVVEQQGELSRLREEREQLERELETQTAETQKQVSVLQFQVQTSEGLLQELQKSFSQSQNAVQSRLSALFLSQRRMCNELSRLKGQEIVETDEEGDTNTSFSPALQGPHCEERLRIEIVNLKEQLDTRAEESEVLEAQLSSLKTETEHIQYQKEGLQVELQGCRTELQGLRVALSHLQGDCKALSNDKAAMHQQCLELRSQVISLRSQVDTSQTVQRDFVQLSQSLQVKLELIRQAETLDQVRQILGEGLTEDGATPTDAM